MENSYLAALDEYFCRHYSDYVRLSAIEGYVSPEVIYVAPDGNIARRDSSCMRLCYQQNAAQLLQRLKETLTDTDFTFSYAFPTVRERIKDISEKNTFAKLLPAALHRCDETVESAGAKLDVEPRFWNMIVKGKLYPEKNTVLALALATRMQRQDASNLLAVCGFGFDEANVRDVVVRYLLEQGIFNEEMRDACLAEYKIVHLPIKR